MASWLLGIFSLACLWSILGLNSLAGSGRRSHWLLLIAPYGKTPYIVLALAGILAGGLAARWNRIWALAAILNAIVLFLGVWAPA